ncbi:sulfatase-like hydrolase/transferase [Candidatus Poribacteria bacterium]|nr:sulfatase-like hydrolase/transferase [Candidatus Poribacteria bacterium]
MSNRYPNIVYIMADDMGYGDVGCYGATKIPTPNMDKLAGEGIRFTDAHSSSAVCTPSRYSVLTGRYCWRTSRKSGVGGGFSLPLIDPARMTVASMLRSKGYATAAVGKWHVGLEWQPKDGERIEWENWADEGHVDYTKPVIGGPNDLGFDYSFCIAGSLDMPPYCFIENGKTVGIPSEEKNPYNAQQKKGFMTSGWKDEEVDVNFAQKAVEFMENCDPDKPFFLYLTPSAPHRPCVAPDFLKGKSHAGPRGDMVCLVDWVVGQITETLERLDIVDNTLIIITSDNGARPSDVDGNTYGHKSCGDLRGYKADIWDGGHREPFIVRWPEKITSGFVSGNTICLADFMATCAEIVDAKLLHNSAEDSFSFLPALLGENDKPTRDSIIHHSVDGMFSIRKGSWKLIEALGSGGFSQPRRIDPKPGEPKGQLYHMDDDLQESENLWDKKPEIVEELTRLLDKQKTQGRSRDKYTL